MRRRTSIVVAILAVGATLPGCASKGYVQRQVKQVNDKVETLSTSVEQTQERTKRNEAEIAQVDQRTAAAQGAANGAQQAANAAGTSASTANSKADAAGARADKVGAHVDEVDKNGRRLLFTVILSDAQSNFKSGDVKLPDEAKAKIDALVNELKADPKGAYFEIEGHTDSLGDKKMNEKLGLDRAEVVKRYLYEQHQIPLHKMNVISYGADKPVAPNNNKEGRAQNRRVVIKVLV